MKKKLLIGIMFLATTTAYAGMDNKVTGDFRVQFNTIQAVTNTGTPDAKHNAYCGKTYQEFISSPMSVHYVIDPVSLYETASIQYLGTAVRLYPEALEDKYYFMSDGVGQLKSHHISRIIIGMDASFSNKFGDMVLVGENHTFNCVLSGPGQG